MNQYRVTFIDDRDCEIASVKIKSPSIWGAGKQVPSEATLIMTLSEISKVERIVIELVK